MGGVRVLELHWASWALTGVIITCLGYWGCLGVAFDSYRLFSATVNDGEYGHG